MLKLHCHSMKLKCQLPCAIACFAMLATLFCTMSTYGDESSKLRLPPLSTSGSGLLPGKFVWADLVTDDVPAARDFYGRLFGWIYQDLGGYVIAKNQDRPLCGMFQRPRPQDGKASPRWIGYISVPNVSKAAKVVTREGGSVIAAPQKLPDRGQQAVFADAEGAVFGVVRSSSGDPQDFLPEPGDWIWVQLLSRDARKAGEFYRAIAGYDVQENTSSKRTNDFVLIHEGYARAAVLTIPEEHNDVQPNWLPFVRVADVKGTVVKAKDLGGRVLIQPKPDLFEGKLGVIADPTGAAIGLLEWSQDEVKGGQ